MVVRDEIKELLASIKYGDVPVLFLADTPKSALASLRSLKLDGKGGQQFILLILPVDEVSDGRWTDVTCSFVLGTATEQAIDTDTRQIINFTPILEPIYAQFERLIRIGNHRIKSNYKQKITKINQYHWGQEQTILQEYIDCIEVKNVQLKIKNQNC